MEARRPMIQPIDDDARRLARNLVRGARFGALASIMPGDGAPLASRVLVACDACGDPLLLVSGLAAHSSALAANPRCSILFGEVGHGDPLAFARISVFGEAEPLDDADRTDARERFLARHPSAEAYCDFADFRLLRVSLAAASLNAGFARAYALVRDDLADPPRPDLHDRLRRAAAHMNADHADAVNAIALSCGAVAEGSWRIVTADSRGFELANSGRLVRAEFEQPIADAEDIRPAFVALAKAAAQFTSPIA